MDLKIKDRKEQGLLSRERVRLEVTFTGAIPSRKVVPVTSCQRANPSVK